MFTGIITDVGRVDEIEKRSDWRVRIATTYQPDTIAIGASIACAGICLTVVETGSDGGNWFAVDASAETARATTLANWREGDRVNLERSLRIGDELGGHLVSGHVDGVAYVRARESEGDSEQFTFEAPDGLMRFIAPKGAVTLDGTSLTVNEVEGNRFTVNLIPHTLEVTTWGLRKTGAPINLEIDMLARYVARLNQHAESART